jgi:hypothetical protein
MRQIDFAMRKLDLACERALQAWWWSIEVVVIVEKKKLGGQTWLVPSAAVTATVKVYFTWQALP